MVASAVGCHTGVLVGSTSHRLALRAHLCACMPRHVHEPYSAEDDAFLWAHQDDIDVVAEALGRGTKSCTSRLERLRNPRSEGYQRLFGDDDEPLKSGGLRPARDCLQRIKHDPLLSAKDFVVGYRDRFEATLRRVPFDAPNRSVRGNERQMVLALPEHRIESFWFKSRLVWHKRLRIDDIFGSRGGLRIHQVVNDYVGWERETSRRLGQARRRAWVALGSSKTADHTLLAFKKELMDVRDGRTSVEAFVDVSLSDDFFGVDGNGNEAAAVAERGETVQTQLVAWERSAAASVAARSIEDSVFESRMIEGGRRTGSVLSLQVPSPVVVDLVRTLPDSHVDLRDALVAALQDRLACYMCQPGHPANNIEH